jgi:hydrogenase expression/formation protein HypE
MKERFVMVVMRAGKVPPDVLTECVFPYLGASDSDVLLGPGIGRDAAILRIGRQVAVASTDPITGAVQQIGAYALHICANDVATLGIRPRWFLATILLPEGAGALLLKTIMTQMHAAAKALNVAIVGGHSEMTPGLQRPIVVGFMLGVAERGRYVTSSNAKPDDVIILTKGVGIEGTAILAAERAEKLRRHLGDSLLERAQKFVTKLSVVPEALQAMKTGAVTAMHDPTEGGVANGLHELADASKLGFIIRRDALIVHEETQRICAVLQANPLDLISSGAMLIAVRPRRADRVIAVLKEAGISASILGRLVKDSTMRAIVEPDGSQVPLPQPTEDALWAALVKPL